MADEQTDGQNTRHDRGDQGRRDRRPLPGRASRDLPRDRDPRARTAPRWWPRCSSTWATTGCARWPSTPPTAWPAARRSSTPARRSRCRWGSVTLGPHLQRARRRRSTRAPKVEVTRALADPPRRARPRPARPDRGDLRDRDQGRRPARPLREGRQGRPVRRRRRGQDGAHPGADPQHRPGARRPVGVRRRRRAHPRGQRPLAGDEGERGHREDRPGLRPDERAPGRPPAGGAVRA